MMIFFIFLYILIQLGIGVWASRRVKNERDFLVAGRSVSSLLLVFSLFSTWFGAETIMGTSGEVYFHGLAGSRADPLGYALCLLLLGTLIAKRIWKEKYLTLGDFFRERFGAKTEKFVILILVISSLIWASAQIRAFGQIFSHYSKLPLWLTMSIGFGLVVIYSFLGGLLGDIITDFIQGFILILGLLFLLGFMWVTMDGWSLFQNIPEDRFLWTLPEENWGERIERWVIALMGSLIAQESITRILSCRSPQQAQRVSFYSAGIYLIVGSIPVFLGLIGPQLLVHLQDKEQFIIELAQQFLPVWGSFIFVGALVSAILSTIDSILISGGGLVSHNFLIPRLKVELETQKLFLTRLSLIMMASISFLIALSSDGIYQLVEIASSWGSSGLVVVTLFGLWTRWGNGTVALITLFAGVLSLTLFSQVLDFQTPYLWSLVLCGSIYFIGSIWVLYDSRRLTQI